MRRADRLFEILQNLRGGRLRTARDLAEKLEVSTRTIWRDVADMQAQGIPIEGERGVGYLLRENFFLPPLALTGDEMEALSWGVALVEAYGDGHMAAAARELAVKIAAVTSESRGGGKIAMSAFAAPTARAAKEMLAGIRRGIAERRKIAIAYCDLRDRHSRRVVHPLNLEFWGQVWTLTAWCELRNDFRVFRCDRLAESEVLNEHFRDEKGKRLADFLAKTSKGNLNGTPY